MYLSKKISFLFLFIIISVSALAQSSQLSYLALGDSYTIGESVDEAQRWPVQLVGELQKEGITISQPKIIAKTGWTTLDLKSAIADAELKPPYNLVSLLIGVNDQYQGKDIANYPENFRFLLDKAIELTGGQPDHVIVLSIPDYGVTLFGQQKSPRKIDRELKAYNDINEEISNELGVIYVDIFPVSKKALKNKELVASDELHPSGKMYQLWVDEVMPKLLPKIKSW